MDKLFDVVLELSWQAGLIALAVMAVRLLLRRRASRRALCLLWVLVALRLVLPVRFTVESPVSLQAEETPVNRVYHAMQEAGAPAPSETVTVPAKPSAPSDTTAAVIPASPAAEMGTLRLFARYLPWLWVMGMGGMAAYMLLSLVWMRLTLRRAEHVRDNVYRCAQWSTPFVLGIIAPRIYVPESVSPEDLPQVLAHERCHIRRWDHVMKPFAFLLLAVHWFNPVLWASYILLGRDMENACDELALKNADTSRRAAYSRALVSCAAQPKMAAVCPLAFGEVAVKGEKRDTLQKACGLGGGLGGGRGGHHRRVSADEAGGGQGRLSPGREGAVRSADALRGQQLRRGRDTGRAGNAGDGRYGGQRHICLFHPLGHEQGAYGRDGVLCLCG